MHEQVYMAVVPYRAESRRDGQMIEVTIPALSIPMCANCGELLFTDKVDEQIQRALAATEPPVVDELRRCLEVRDGTKWVEDGVEYFIPHEDICKIEQRWLETCSTDPRNYQDIPNARFILKILEMGSRAEIN